MSMWITSAEVAEAEAEAAWEGEFEAEQATAAEARAALRSDGPTVAAVASYLAPGPQPRYDTPQARAEAQADREAGQ